MRRFVEKLVDRGTTRRVRQGDGPVAVAFAFREGDGLMGLVDALDADAPGAREHVAAAMAALVRAMPGPFECDGHASGAHYPAVLAGIPHATAGPLTPLDLLRLS